MRRREFITLLSRVAAAWPLAAQAQQPDRVRRIGVLLPYTESDHEAQSWFAAFREALRNIGWTEGSNLRIEVRWSARDADRMRTFAKELVDLRPDAILCDTTPTIAALARETRTIPIVFTAVADPVVSGFVQSLAHPGGNLTGFMTQAPAIGGKWVGLLKEIAPRTVRGAMLFNPATAPTPQLYIHFIESVATSLAIHGLLDLCADRGPLRDYPDLPDEWEQIGREYFARSPGSIWVHFDDLPEATANALWERLKPGEAYSNVELEWGLDEVPF
jgi:putative tryptophan/tyrosine transport system substrate-binding protein